MNIVKTLSALNTASEMLLKAIHLRDKFTRDDVQKVMGYLRTSNPDIIKWVGELCGETLPKPIMVLPAIPGHAHGIDAQGQLTCGCHLFTDTNTKAYVENHQVFIKDEPKGTLGTWNASAAPDPMTFQVPYEISLNDYVNCHIIAKNAHEGQMGKYEDAKEHYFNHCLRVAGLAQGGRTIKAVALLHDVLEDTRVTADDLKARGVPSFIIAAVKILTRSENPHNYMDYIKMVHASGNPLAIGVKIADLEDHLHRAGCPLHKRLVYLRALKVFRPTLRYCETCGHLWGAYEDYCECKTGGAA